MSKLNNEQLLTAYVSSGFNLTRTAQQLNICRQTVSKRIKSNEFQALLTEYRKNLFQQSSQILLENTLRASKTLVKLLNSKSENIKLQTAVKILNLSADYTTIDDLQQELNSLKEIINKE
jgi:IS30 family transposase